MTTVPLTARALSARVGGAPPPPRLPPAQHALAPVVPDPLIAVVLACGLEAGLPVDAALGAVADWLSAADHPRAAALRRLRAAPEQPSGCAFVDDVGQALSLARHCGVPPAHLVRQAGARARGRARAQRQARLSRLPVLLVLPSGLLLLPAALLLGVVPVVVDLLGRVLGGTAAT
ncbi:MAG: hypothetical protein U0Q15_07925 [Kineosporiaceae bacterium]